MKTEELEAIRHVFPFLKGYALKGNYISVEESPGGLNLWKVEKRYDDYYGNYYLSRILELLNQEGKVVLQVGVRKVWHPPKKFLWWTVKGKTETEIFTETVTEAIHRAQEPIHYMLSTYPAGTSFILYKPPEGKTLEEWGRERTRREAKRLREIAAENREIEREKENQAEAAIQIETKRLLVEIQTIDAKGNSTTNNPPSTSIN